VSIVELDVIRLRSTGGECCTLEDGDIVIAANERQVFKSQKKDEEPTLKWVWRRMSGHYCRCLSELRLVLDVNKTFVEWL
jgi:hypothetical protein